MEKQIIFCNCRGEIIKEDDKKLIDSILKKSAVGVVELVDLCGIAVSDPNAVSKLFTDIKETLFIACHPRAVELLLKKSGVSSPNNISFVNLRETPAEAVEQLVAQFTSGTSTSDGHLKVDAPKDWNAWYPVVDEERCTSCGQCADFCLFGVYEKGEEKVNVVYPQGCKYNCPACGRVCPEMAIVFPKYTRGGAVSGANTFDEQKEHDRLQRDTNAILGNDIYKALEARKLKRRSIINAEAMKIALEERSKAEAERGNSTKNPNE